MREDEDKCDALVADVQMGELVNTLLRNGVAGAIPTLTVVLSSVPDAAAGLLESLASGVIANGTAAVEVAATRWEEEEGCPILAPTRFQGVEELKPLLDFMRQPRPPGLVGQYWAVLTAHFPVDGLPPPYGLGEPALTWRVEWRLLCGATCEAVAMNARLLRGWAEEAPDLAPPAAHLDKRFAGYAVHAWPLAAASPSSDADGVTSEHLEALAQRWEPRPRCGVAWLISRLLRSDGETTALRRHRELDAARVRELRQAADAQAERHVALLSDVDDARARCADAAAASAAHRRKAASAVALANSVQRTLGDTTERHHRLWAELREVIADAASVRLELQDVARRHNWSSAISGATG